MRTPSKFTRRVFIKAPLEKIYNAWSTQNGLEKWFLRFAEFTGKDGNVRKRKTNCMAGDQYHWLWHGHSDDVLEKNKVLFANGKDKISFTFSGGCRVLVQLSKQKKNLTLIELSQDQFPKKKKAHFDYYYGCSMGWTFYLANMKSVFEGGNDLRNKNEKFGNVVNA